MYLQPLIDELKTLWNGVLTYDISKKQNFQMRVALLWTINDFTTYGTLSGWSTYRKLAYPICMHRSKEFGLGAEGKHHGLIVIIVSYLCIIHLEETQMNLKGTKWIEADLINACQVNKYCNMSHNYLL